VDCPLPISVLIFALKSSLILRILFQLHSSFLVGLTLGLLKLRLLPVIYLPCKGEIINYEIKNRENKNKKKNNNNIL
jgi:O-antigen ligase